MNVILEPMIFCPWRKIFLVQKIESSKNISERKEFWKKKFKILILSLNFWFIKFKGAIPSRKKWMNLKFRNFLEKLEI
jgi:hypothetical protein